MYLMGLEPEDLVLESFTFRLSHCYQLVEAAFIAYICFP